eukprot:TRINITY_DN141_c0_g1_i1.p1 TRINITY_DN141_c0_g1~~TRINITY_DN141_c0_g1_i1.p1  ORF type:complete len:308 (+),score=7.99 TRINITY_DN141_c0_g1_i1:842-1765(+)
MSQPNSGGNGPHQPVGSRPGSATAPVPRMQANVPDQRNTCGRSGCSIVLPEGSSDCGRCPVHCTGTPCEDPVHKLVRSSVASACRLNQMDVVRQFPDLNCPCGAALQRHPRALTEQAAGATTTSIAGEQAGALQASAALAESTRTMGLSAAQLNKHPSRLPAGKWREIITAIRGRSADELKLLAIRSRLENNASSSAADAQQGAEVSVKQVVLANPMQGRELREIAGLLATITALATHAAAMPGYAVTVSRAAIVGGQEGSMPAAGALNDVLIGRLEDRGRRWFYVPELHLPGESSAPLLRPPPIAP